MLADGQPVDSEIATFGIRDARFEAPTGFWLNGRNIKMKGVCLHHDGGAVGAAVPLRVWERRLQRLKSLGVNAIRTAHNPPAPGFLDLTDRLGLLVMDEVWDAWTIGKNHANYGVHLLFPDWWKADTRDTVLRDRNHPSVVLWSAGNEIHDTPIPDLAKRVLRGLLDVFHAHDPSRPVTQGALPPEHQQGLRQRPRGHARRGRPELPREGAGRRVPPEADAQGRRHREPPRARRVARAARPSVHGGPVPLAGHRLPGRGGLAPDDVRARPARPHGRAARGGLGARELVVGPGRGPRRSGAWPRRRGRRSIPATTRWLRPPPPPAPILREDWTPADRAPHDEDVEVYSNADEVELLLNGRRVGRLPRNVDASPRIFRVTYAPGTLKAVARNRGRVVAAHELRTAGPAARIALNVDETSIGTSWDDVAHVTARIVDASGVPVPDAEHAVTFATSGPAQVIAVDDGDPQSHEPYVATVRTAFRGRVLAIVRATGAGTRDGHRDGRRARARDGRVRSEAGATKPMMKGSMCCSNEC